MDIARLLRHDDSEVSDAEPPVVGVVVRPSRGKTPYAPGDGRRVARGGRQRKPSMASLRAQVEAYEYVVANLPSVLRDLAEEDEDEAGTATATATTTTSSESENDHTFDADLRALRMRAFLKRTVVLTEQALEERAKRDEYLRLLKHHHDSTASLRKLMRGLALDDWFWLCDRWRSLTEEYYKPFPSARCFRLVQETLRDIKAFKVPGGGALRNNTSFFGWNDSRILIKDEGHVQFTTRKTYQHIGIEAFVDHSWSIYQDGERYKQYMLGDHCELFHQILQRVTPDIMIMQTIEQYRGMAKRIHSLSIVFRVATETGYLIVVRCTPSPELASVMQCEGLATGDNFFWGAWDVTERDADGECVEFQSTIGGCIGSDYPGYAKWWVTELVLGLVRAETNMGLPLASLESEDVHSDSSS